MAFGFSKSRVSPIGIDFGADSVKLLQVVPGATPADTPQLVAAGAAVVPDAARRDAGARVACLEEALRKLLRNVPFKGRRVVLSFPAFQTLMQHLEVSKAEGEDFDAQVAASLRGRLMIDASRMVIRHFPVRQFSRDGVKLDEVICLAAARDVVTGYLDLAHRLKLDVAGMHAEPNALLKAFEHCTRGGDGATGFVDLGYATSKFVVAHDGRIVIGKTIHAAGEHLTHAFAKERKCDLAEAHRARRGGAGAALLEAPVKATTACETTETIVDELRLSLRYHASLFPEKPVEKLIFVGGEARHRATCQAIARGVGVAAQLGDPLARLSKLNVEGAEGVSLDEPQPGWAVAMGLCLSEAAA